MNQTDNYKKTEEIEIDLADLLRSFCRKWKQAAVCALAGMILLGGYGYWKSRNAELPEEPSAKESMIEEAELTEEERWSVAEAVQLKKENDAIADYLENSILMQTDAYNRESVLLQYCIHETDIHTLPKAVESYTAFLSYGQAAEAVQESEQAFRNIKPSCLSELFSVWQAAEGQSKIIMDASIDSETEKIFYVEVTGKDKKMAQQLAAAVKKALGKYASSVKKKCGSHELALLNEISRTRADSTLLSQQREKRELLKAGRSSLKTLTDSMSEIQKLAYAEEAGIEKEEETLEIAAASGRGSVLKYIIFGLCAGIFAYGGIFVCLYLLRNAVRSESEFQAYYRIPLYGSMSVKKAAAKSGPARDESQKRLAQTLGRVRLACKKQGIQKLCLAAEFAAGTKEQAVLEHILKQLQDWGIHTVMGKVPDSDISQWDMLEEAGTVLLVCSIGETTYPMVNHAMEFYLENDIDVMGAVLLDGR